MPSTHSPTSLVERRVAVPALEPALVDLDELDHVDARRGRPDARTARTPRCCRSSAASGCCRGRTTGRPRGRSDAGDLGVDVEQDGLGDHGHVARPGPGRPRWRDRSSGRPGGPSDTADRLGHRRGWPSGLRCSWLGVAAPRAAPPSHPPARRPRASPAGRPAAQGGGAAHAAEEPAPDAGSGGGARRLVGEPQARVVQDRPLAERPGSSGIALASTPPPGWASPRPAVTTARRRPGPAAKARTREGRPPRPRP